MSTGQTRSGRTPAPVKMITTDTGRILRISPDDESARAAAAAAATPAPENIDPARRTDVLFRVRHAEGHELSSVVDDRRLRRHLRSRDRPAQLGALQRLTVVGRVGDAVAELTQVGFDLSHRHPVGQLGGCELARSALDDLRCRLER